MYDHNLTITAYADYIADMADLYGDAMPTEEDMAAMYEDAISRGLIAA